MHHRIAALVGKIVQSTKPAGIPVEATNKNRICGQSQNGQGHWD
jgi:hypothetical protein